MPHAVKIVKELDGDRHLIIRVFIKGDGVSNDLAGHTIMDPRTTPLPTLPGEPFATIEEVWFDLDGFNIRLDFDDVVDPPAWTLSQSASNYVDFRSMGGIADRSGLDGTGKLLLSTIGLDTEVKQGTIIIKMRK
tara:strand:+ start:516 stop:917 length:402 start_codon:yes stop_codon:yes gene_type:complete